MNIIYIYVGKLKVLGFITNVRGEKRTHGVVCVIMFVQSFIQIGPPVKQEIGYRIYIHAHAAFVIV